MVTNYNIFTLCIRHVSRKVQDVSFVTVVKFCSHSTVLRQCVQTAQPFITGTEENFAFFSYIIVNYFQFVSSTQAFIRVVMKFTNL
jgi:hypothetical protein